MSKLTLGLVVVAVSLGGCAAQVAQKENMLAAAGFTYRAAATPQAAVTLKTLPPHKFVHQIRGGKSIWIYADPSICGCLYAGDDAAYQQYRQMVFQKQIADEQTQAAMLNQNAAMEQQAAMMNWAVWGPWAPYYVVP
jgi:hypothetical protein